MRVLKLVKKRAKAVFHMTVEITEEEFCNGVIKKDAHTTFITGFGPGAPLPGVLWFEEDMDTL